MKTKGILLASLLALSPLVADEQSLQRQIDELTERVDQNELQAALSKVKFGLDFNTSVNNFFINNNGGTGAGWNQPNKWLMGVYLNMNADVTKYAKFTGRLAMTKAFGDLSWMPVSTAITSLDTGKGFSGGTAIYVERAYVDLFLGNYLAFTVGRLPGTEGPGYNLRNGAARMSTYPALLVNALGDGGVITLKPYTDSALRVGFAKVYQPLYVTANSGAGSIFNESGGYPEADMNLWFAAFETPFLPKSAGKSLAMLSYVYVTNYSLPNALLSQGLSAALAERGQNISATTINGGLPGGDGTNIGDLSYLNLHLENYNLYGSGFSWFFSFTWQNGSNAQNFLSATGNLSSLAPSVPLLQQGVFSEGNAFALHVGARQDLGKYFKIGYEYFHGSDRWYAFSRVSANDPMNIRNTRGNVHDVYVIWQLDQFQFFRLSYTYLHRNHRMASSFSAPVPTDVGVQNLSLAYILRF